MNIIRRQLMGENFTRCRINTQMQFAPDAAFTRPVGTYLPFSLAKNFQPGAVDYQTQG